MRLGSLNPGTTGTNMKPHIIGALCKKLTVPTESFKVNSGNVSRTYSSN